MKAYRLPNGNMMVPKRAESDAGHLGDGMIEVKPGSPDYQAWLPYLQVDEHHALFKPKKP